jgi:heme A synthase
MALTNFILQKKYDFLKSWVIFSLLHESLTVLGHLAVGFFMWTPILAFHLPLSLPFLALLIWLTLRLMAEIKQKQIREREAGGPRLKIGKKGAKAKNLYKSDLKIIFEEDGEEPI